MTVYAMWHGGHSYSHGQLPEDLEVFPSIRAAGEALLARYESNGGIAQSITYADGREVCVFFPTVDTTCSMEIYRVDPRVSYGEWVAARGPFPDPDLRLTLGPRLGIRRERY